MTVKREIKLDEVDLEIIRRLALTGREGIRELARSLGKSPSTIVFRIRRLEEAGIIKGFTTLIDYRKLGYQINALTLIQVDGAYIERVEEMLAKEKNVRAVYDITGGNPRLLIYFYEFITRETIETVEKEFMKMVEDLTPYYQEKMGKLSPQQSRIIEFLSERRDAVDVKTIAEQCLMTHQIASNQLKKLLSYGYVSKTEIGRNSYYELAEEKTEEKTVKYDKLLAKMELLRDKALIC